MSSNSIIKKDFSVEFFDKNNKITNTIMSKHIKKLNICKNKISLLIVMLNGYSFSKIIIDSKKIKYIKINIFNDLGEKIDSTKDKIFLKDYNSDFTKISCNAEHSAGVFLEFKKCKYFKWL